MKSFPNRSVSGRSRPFLTPIPLAGCLRRTPRVTASCWKPLAPISNYLFTQKGTRRIYLYTEEDNLSCQRLSEKLGMRKEGVFREFVTFVNDEKGDPLYETTLQYAILKKEWQS